MPGVDQVHGETTPSSSSNSGIQYTPVDSIATVSTPQAASQSAMLVQLDR